MKGDNSPPPEIPKIPILDDIEAWPAEEPAAAPEEVEVAAPLSSSPDPIPGWLPGGRIHLLGGSAQAGKTSMAARLLRSILEGREPLTGLPAANPTWVGAIFTDRQWSDNAHAFEREGFLEALPYYSMVGDRDTELLFNTLSRKEKSWSGGFEAFKFCVEKLNPPRGALLWIDVLSTPFLGPNVQDPVSVHRHMVLIQNFLLKHQLTVLGSVYGGKQVTDSKQRYLRHEDRIVGAVPLRGCASSILYITTPEESEVKGFQQLTWKPRAFEGRTFNLRRDQEGRLVEASQEELREAAPEEGAGGEQRVLEILPATYETVKTSEILRALQAKGLEVSRMTAYRWLAALVRDGLAESPGKGLWKRRAAC